MTKTKTIFLTASLLVMIMTFFSQGSHAFYTTTAKSTSAITMGEIEMLLHEESSTYDPLQNEGEYYVTPGDVISKIVYVENICKEPFYVRIKPVFSVDSNNLSPDCFKLNLNTESFTYSDGWYYYNYEVDPGQCTPYFFTNVEIVGSKVDNAYLGKTLTMKVVAHAVQSKNNPLDDGPQTAYGWPE